MKFLIVREDKVRQCMLFLSLKNPVFLRKYQSNHKMYLRYWIFSWVFLVSSFCYSQSYDGTVIRVIDGDTYVFQTLGGSFIVRMQGTDAPERDQPFAKESAKFLQQYLNKEAVTEVSGIDRYARRLGTLFVGGHDINLLTIRTGNAWHFKRYSSDQQYAEAGEYARKNRSGLWKLENPIPPWNWRQIGMEVK